MLENEDALVRTYDGSARGRTGLFVAALVNADVDAVVVLVSLTLLITPNL